MCECGVGQNSDGEEERDACVARGLNIPREFRRPLACGRSVPGVWLGSFLHVEGMFAQH